MFHDVPMGVAGALLGRFLSLLLAVWSRDHVWIQRLVHVFGVCMCLMSGAHIHMILYQQYPARWWRRYKEKANL